MLIRQEYEIPAPAHDVVSSDAPGISEANALRYAAGYVVRQVSRKVKKCTGALQDKLVHQSCLKEIKTTVTQEQRRNGQPWWTGVDFGTYERQPFNFSVHLKRKHSLRGLCSPNASALHSDFLNKLLASEDIKFYWCVVTADCDVEDTDIHDVLLRIQRIL